MGEESVSNGLAGTYCVTAEGQKFLMQEPVVKGGEVITVVLNWMAALPK